MPKKGNSSVGVAPQYATRLGKTANCQTLVSLTLARGEVPVVVGLTLCLPETWTADSDWIGMVWGPSLLPALGQSHRVGKLTLHRGTVVSTHGYP